MDCTKKISKILSGLLTLITLQVGLAQVKKENPRELSVSPRVGYDLPMFNNDTPYIDYDGGLDLGASVDYYWGWFGIGVDFDYIKNSPRSIFPKENLLFAGNRIPTDNLLLTSEEITRTFYGVGPNLQFRSRSNNFSAELNARIGLASIKGGLTELLEIEGENTLNFHSGYDLNNVLSAKAQIRFTYFFTKNLGINAGGYFLGHLNTTDLLVKGRSGTYYPYEAGVDGRNNPVNVLDANPAIRSEGLGHDIFSIGAFAGITYRMTKKSNTCNVCNLDHQPHCSADLGCTLTITAKDKFSNEVLPNTEISIENIAGRVIESGTADANGVITFSALVPETYVIRGRLNGSNLDQIILDKMTFENCAKNGGTIEKELIYSDPNFVMKGNVIECNSTITIGWVNVVLRDKESSTRKDSKSTTSGDFIFHLNQVSTYLLKGNKDGYFSNEIEVDTREYDRSKSLFIDLQMCVDPCGKAIRLKNINFELAKWNILPASESELDYLVKLMQDNPDIKVEMSSHTDARGGTDFNLNLSQKRAQATVDYLVDQGIDGERLLAKGAGETELLNSCYNGVECSEDAHAMNRRTEFKVVCKE